MYSFNDKRPEICKRFVNQAMSAWRNRKFIGVIICGEFGKGKTSTACQLASDIFKRIYPDENDDEIDKRVLECILFTRQELKKALTRPAKKIDWEHITPIDALKQSKDIRQPVYIWDDASIHGSKHLRNEKISYEIQSNFDQIRDACSCMIVTLPESDELLKTIREYRGFYKAELITQKNKRNIRTIFFKRKTIRNGRRIWKPKMMSKEFPVKLDDEFYGRYIIKRNLAKLYKIREEENKEKLEETKQRYYTKKMEYLQKKMDDEMKTKQVTIEENNMELPNPDFEVEE